MSPRAEYFNALLAANPDLIVTSFVSLLLCAIVFVGALVLKNPEKFKYAADLPLAEDSANEPQKGSL